MDLINMISSMEEKLNEISNDIEVINRDNLIEKIVLKQMISSLEIEKKNLKKEIQRQQGIINQLRDCLNKDNKPVLRKRKAIKISD